MTTTTSPLLAFRNTVVCCVAASALLTLAACDKGSDATGTAVSTTSGTAATPAAAAKPKATVKLADVNAVYKAEIDNTSKMNEPMPRKVAAFLAKVGKPSLDEGRTKTWYALDGAGCSKVVLDTKDGSMSDGTTARSDCGM